MEYESEGRSGFVNGYEELQVYKEAFSLLDDIYQLSLIFPKDEKFSLTDQIRRSSRSVGAQIAEAWGKRRYPKHFISKLTDADAERFKRYDEQGPFIFSPKPLCQITRDKLLRNYSR